MKSYKRQAVSGSVMQSARVSLIFYCSGKSRFARRLRKNINNIYHAVYIGPPESPQAGYVHPPRKLSAVTLLVS